MGRRRNEGLAEVLIALPWQVSAVLAVAAFVLTRWIVPGLLPRTQLGDGLRLGLQGLSWMPSLFFGMLALIAFLKARHGKHSIAGAEPRDNGRSRPRAARFAAPKTLPDAWGSSVGTRPLISDRTPSSSQWGTSAGEMPASDNSSSNRGYESNQRPTCWSVDALRMLEWKRFELLCSKYYEIVGFKAETLAAGPDGGVDVKLYKVDPDKPLAVVQCKAWAGRLVGVKEVRELLGVMAHEKVARGIFITTSGYTAEAAAFGSANPIQLLDGEAFLHKLLDLTPEKQQALLVSSFDGDYGTPTCASCGVKMVKREGKRRMFWGCVHYPRCRSTLAMRS